MVTEYKWMHTLPAIELVYKGEHIIITDTTHSLLFKHQVERTFKYSLKNFDDETAEEKFIEDFKFNEKLAEEVSDNSGLEEYVQKLNDGYLIKLKERTYITCSKYNAEIEFSFNCKTNTEKVDKFFKLNENEVYAGYGDNFLYFIKDVKFYYQFRDDDEITFFEIKEGDEDICDLYMLLDICSNGKIIESNNFIREFIHDKNELYYKDFIHCGEKYVRK